MKNKNYEQNVFCSRLWPHQFVQFVGTHVSRGHPITSNIKVIAFFKRFPFKG